MNQAQLQEQIALYYSKLPPDVQTVFSSMKWMESLQDISKKYDLNEEQIQTLGTETTLVLLGIISLDEYERVLNNELRVEASLLLKMVKEIEESIIKSIRPQLNKVYEIHVESLIEEKYGGVEKLDERFEKLPKEVQEAISESNYQSTLYKIAEKYKLSINQMGALEEATTKVMLSITHPDKYEAELQASINIPKDKITELVADVNEGVLKNIRDILKSHWDKDGDEKKNIDDEVPLPPYVNQPMIKESLPEKYSVPIPQKTEISGTESTIYKDSGIEMVDEVSGDKIPMKEDTKVVKSDSMDMLANKLSGLTASVRTVSDQSIPKIGLQSVPKPPAPPNNLPTKGRDPYHEEIV